METIQTELLASVTGGGKADLGKIAGNVMSWLGKGAVQKNTPKGATQFMSPGGDKKIRFDLSPEQHKGAGPHINVEEGSKNVHVPLSE